MNGTLPLPIVHGLKNQLAIVLGFCELLLADTAATDRRRSDIERIQMAARASLELLSGSEPMIDP
jgi:hypothetical protein